MVKRTSVALLITTYNWPEALRLVLESVLTQHVLPDEIVIADDGSGEPTKAVIDAFRQKSPIPVRHFWHKDDGFRKTVIVNQAIGGTTCDYIIQIDGDILLHPHFVEDHINEAEKGYYVRGSRVMVSEAKSNGWLHTGQPARISFLEKGIRNRINSLYLPLLAPLFIKKDRRADNAHGCNVAFWREDFVKVNGYNNDLLGWGHEDIELAARFVNLGLSQKKVKLKAVCYHLHHTHNPRHRERVNYQVYEDTLRRGIIACANGYQVY